MNEGILVSAAERGGQYHLVFGIGLLREHRPRQIEFAPRPPVVRALGAHMIEDGLNLLRFQCVAERRHHAVESPHRSAGVDHRIPVRVRLPGREIAVREVRHLKVQESELRNAVTRTVAAVARRAGGVVQLLPGFLGNCRRQTRRAGHCHVQETCSSTSGRHSCLLTAIIRQSSFRKTRGALTIVQTFPRVRIS